MGRMGRGVLLVAALAFAAPAQSAEPLLMFLLGIAREMLTNAVAESISRPAPAPEPLATYPGTAVAPEQLRRLIDESFFYLSAAQRGEIFDSLNAELMKPQNAAVRGAMIEYFAERALTVREAQLRLAQLSYGEKQRLAEEFRRETAAIPDEERARLQEILARGLLPVPADLNQLLLAALEPGPAAGAPR